MSDLSEHAGEALDLLIERIPKAVQRDAPDPAAYALAIWLEWGRGDWFRWLPMLTLMQERRLDAQACLGTDRHIAFWDPWGVPPEEWARPWEISHGTAGVVAGAAADLSVSPRAARVLEPLQDAWLDASEPTIDGLLFEDWFGVQLARRLDRLDWQRLITAAGRDLVVYFWPEHGRASSALRASVSERHHERLISEGVWPP
jgi:hypothetical protein